MTDRGRSRADRLNRLVARETGVQFQLFSPRTVSITVTYGPIEEHQCLGMQHAPVFHWTLVRSGTVNDGPWAVTGGPLEPVGSPRDGCSIPAVFTPNGFHHRDIRTN